MATRRQLLKSIGITSVSAALGIPAVSKAQAPVVDTLRIIVGFPPGGTSDGFARRLAAKLQGTYAAHAVVENKSGAGGQIAVTALRDSAADGSVMLLTPAGMLIIYPHTYPKLPYTINDVLPISTVNYGSHGFGVGPQVPASVKTLREFLDWAKANPSLANYGTPAAGSMPYLVAALMEKMSGVPRSRFPIVAPARASRICWRPSCLVLVPDGRLPSLSRHRATASSCRDRHDALSLRARRSHLHRAGLP